MRRLTKVFENDRASGNPAASKPSGWRPQLCAFRRRKEARCRGVSLVELLLVLAMIVIVAAISLPSLVGSRRLIRSTAIPRQILTEMRLARQQAMTQRRAVTVQYDDQMKRLVVINHRASGAALLTAAGYPQTAGSVQEKVISLADSGVNTADLTYGIPPALPGTANAALDDGVSLTGLTNNQLNVTFQPNGSVVDAAGLPTDRALFIYNNKAPEETACAVSVLGAAGRVKIWKYNRDVQKYVE
jgi:prepilin-type N-terminal cleavage/methylation domain-containing protein